MGDDRVPGTQTPVAVRYKCPVCGKVIASERRPECPVDGVLMDPVKR
jgi:ABC-type ATPase with predicted acetyltransferase domain